MSVEKIREEFEVWALSIGRNTARYDDGLCEYTCLDTESDWVCWQASRAALVIGLPQPLPSGDYRMTVPFYKAVDVEAALCDAGLPV